MKILVTGSSGFIGATLVEYLKNAGYDVNGIDIASKENTEKVDIRDYDKLIEVFKKINPNVVIHLAAIASVPISEEEPRECFETNISGTLNVAKVANMYGAKLIFTSSAAVYGKTQILPTPITTPIVPTNIYGLSKEMGENIVRYFCQNAVVFRLFNVYGPNCNRSYVIPDTIRKLLNNKDKIEMQGTGEERRDFIYINDVIQAIRVAIENDVCGTFNLGTGKTVSIKEVVNNIKILMDKESVPVYFKGTTRIGDFNINWADMEGKNKISGWDSKVELTEGLTNTIKSMVHE